MQKVTVLPMISPAEILPTIKQSYFPFLPSCENPKMIGCCFRVVTSIMTGFSDHLTRVIVFLAIGLVLPLVFLSSLIIFCVVEVGLIVTYTSHTRASFLSRYVLNGMMSPVLYTTHQIILPSIFSRQKKSRYEIGIQLLSR